MRNLISTEIEVAVLVMIYSGDLALTDDHYITGREKLKKSEKKRISSGMVHIQRVIARDLPGNLKLESKG